MISYPTSTGFWHYELFVPGYTWPSDTTIRVVGEDIVYDADGRPVSGTIDSITVTYERGRNVEVPPSGPVLLSGGPSFIIVTTSYTDIDMTVEDLNAIAANWYASPYDALIEGDSGITASMSYLDDFARGDVRLSGGEGDDVLTIESTRMSVYGGDGNDVIRVLGYQSSANGGTGDDLLDGSSGASNDLSGGAGNDTIIGGVGPDVLSGGDGDDLINGGSAPDPYGYTFGGRMQGDAGNDTLIGGAEAEEIFGGTGDDVIRGGGEGDIAFGGEGDDRIAGEAGDDSMQGGDGADILDGGNGADMIDGGAGRDVVRGADGADTLTGGADADTVMGGAGDDVLFASDGNDLLSGNAGADTFVFMGDFGVTRVTDFDVTEDQLALFDGALTAEEMLDLFVASATQVGSTVIYRGGADIVITLSNVDLDALTAANFTSADAFDPVVIPGSL